MCFLLDYLGLLSYTEFIGSHVVLLESDTKYLFHPFLFYAVDCRSINNAEEKEKKSIALLSGTLHPMWSQGLLKMWVVTWVQTNFPQHESSVFMLSTTFSGERKWLGPSYSVCLFVCFCFILFFVSTKSPLLSSQVLEMAVCHIKLQF